MSKPDKGIDVVKVLMRHIECTCPYYSIRRLGPTHLVINYGKRNKKPKITLRLNGTTLVGSIKTKVGNDESNRPEYWTSSFTIDLNDPTSLDELNGRLTNPHRALWK